MKKILLILLVLFSSCQLDAAGIKGKIGAYIDVVENRISLQPLVNPGSKTEASYRALSDAEMALKGELRKIFCGDDDIAEVAMGYLFEVEIGDALLYFRNLIPTDSLSPAARKLLEKMKKIENRRKLGEPTSSELEEMRIPEIGIAGPFGAAILAQPDFRAKVTSIVPAGDKIRISASSGNFMKCSDDAGNSGFIFLGLLSLHEEELNVNFRQADVPPSEDIPPNLAKFQRIKDQRPTFYLTTREEGFPTSGPLFGQNYNGSERKDIKTPAGALVAGTSGRYFASLCMEGSGVIKDGRTVSFVSDQRFNVAPEGCLGITATGYWVIPFHTLAVNKAQMPYKGVYFIPESRGLKLPNGEIHDGYWFAHDTGSAFSNTTDRMDMYVNREEYWKWMEANFVPSFTPIKVYKVDSDTKASVYAKYKTAMGKLEMEVK
ncbi:MAG: hypothetical protein WA705_03410 [Candidatus Ozemobacteraceae bacterium]